MGLRKECSLPPRTYVLQQALAPQPQSRNSPCISSPQVVSLSPSSLFPLFLLLSLLPGLVPGHLAIAQ